MPVTPQSLRNAADFMEKASGVDPVWLREAAAEIETSRASLRRIADSRNNKNWRKPELCDEADRALALSSKDGCTAHSEEAR